MFGKKQKERQVIREEPIDENPMDKLAEESEMDFPQQIPLPPISRSPPVPQAIETDEEMRWVVGEVATSTEKVLHDNITKKSYDIYSAIALILNKAYEE